MQGRNVLMLVALGLTLAGCGGAGKPLRVPVRIVAAFAPAQGGSDPVAEPRASRTVGEVTTVWLTKPVEQQLDYDPQTHVASGVVMVEAGKDILFRAEARREDGVTLYAGENVATLTAGQVNEVSISLTPVPGPLTLTAHVHEVTGPPEVRLTYVPPLGSFEDLEGEVRNINPTVVEVAVYIYVDESWWTKPYWNAPTTPVRNDGTWTCDITTGGIDEQATKIRAYLIRKGYQPPLAPSEGLPPDPPTPDVLALAEATREQGEAKAPQAWRPFQDKGGKQR